MKLSIFKQKLNLPTLLGVTPEAEQKRDELVLRAQSVVSVTNAEEQAVASQNVVALQAHIKATKEAGLDFRRPINDFVSLVKKTEDDYTQKMTGEKERIGRLLVDFSEKEERRIAAEEKKRQEEYEAAEAKRIADEKAAKDAADKAEASGKKKDESKAEKLAEKALASEEIVQAIAATPIAVASKASGVAMKKTLCYEVTDIHALYKSRPDLVRLEPNARGIQATCDPDMPNKPAGLKLWWNKVPVVRSSV